MPPICRHGPGDPNCSSNRRTEYVYVDKPSKEPKTPDSKKFKLIDIKEINGNLVVKLLYPNCSKCSYEGNKVLVYLNKTIKDFVFWSTIDPHFRENKFFPQSTEAPGPDARFPASKVSYAEKAIKR